MLQRDNIAFVGIRLVLGYASEVYAHIYLATHTAEQCEYIAACRRPLGAGFGRSTGADALQVPGNVEILQRGFGPAH
jgi:hypothetical protein